MTNIILSVLIVTICSFNAAAANEAKSESKLAPESVAELLATIHTVDMSKYTGNAAIQKLIGLDTPGYGGYHDNTKFIGTLAENPGQAIKFAKFYKADQKVRNLILGYENENHQWVAGALESGKLVDNKGNEFEFPALIFIETAPGKIEARSKDEVVAANAHKPKFIAQEQKAEKPGFFRTLLAIAVAGAAITSGGQTELLNAAIDIGTGNRVAKKARVTRLVKGPEVADGTSRRSPTSRSGK